MFEDFYELGGFAESSEVINASSEEDFNSFNFCLAEEYYNAMCNEDFTILGKMSPDLVETIIRWLNYDGSINKDMEEEINKIKTGLFLTCKKRTFIDAIVDNKNVNLAETYIYLGNEDPRLFVISMLYNEYRGTILYLINEKNKDEYILFLEKIFNELEKEYNKMNSEEEKKFFLEKIKYNFEYLKSFEKFVELKSQNIEKYNFVKALCNK